jgi:uncharacterized membrane protein
MAHFKKLKIEKDTRFTKQGKIITIIGLILFLFGIFAVWTDYFISDFSFVALIVGFFACAIGLTLWSGGLIYFGV